MKYNLNTILTKVCEKLSISKLQYKDIQKRYKAISNTLKKGVECDLEIYPQGSVAIGTTIKPIGREEYDLDFVCEAKDTEPLELFNKIKTCLRENGYYSDIVEEKKRCVRLNYKGEFHADILPAMSDRSQSPTSIEIQDKELKEPLPSDPKGYAQWFLGKSIASTGIKIDARIEGLPPYKFAYEKTHLQLIVQLIKRHRNIFFKSQPELSPPSILINTLCGEHYQNTGDLLQDMVHIVNSIKNPPPEIRNPVNSTELLSEKWKENPQLRDLFIKWINTLSKHLESLESGQNIRDLLTEMFGEKIINPIYDEHINTIEKNKNNLHMAVSGKLTTSNSPESKSNPSHTFYGDENEDS